MGNRAIPIPPLFWVEYAAKVPPAHNSTDEYFKEAKESFRFYFDQVRHQEQKGIVDRTDVINLLLSGWALRHNYRLNYEAELKKEVSGMREVAKKYGLTKLWDAAYQDTLLKRTEEKFSGDFSDMARVQCCARCGRAIWADLSVSRGVGPVCFHKG